LHIIRAYQLYQSYNIICSIFSTNHHLYSFPIHHHCLVHHPSAHHIYLHHLSNSSDSPTATTQFGLLNVVPLSFFITASKSSILRHIQSSSFVILLGLLFSGDIQLNPGPTSSTFNICTPNIRSLLNPLKYTAISDLADTRNIDVFALTETWITPSATPSELLYATRSGFFLVSHPRIAPANHAHFVGGGIAFLLRDSAVIIKSPSCPTFKTFELSSVTLNVSSNFSIVN